MRFVTPYPRFSICILEQVEEPDPYHIGRQVTKKKGFTAQFRPGDYTNAEREFVIGRFKFNGLPLQEDALTPVDPGFRIGTYDTDQINWARASDGTGYEPEELKEIVEQKLQDSIYHGSDFIKFDAPPLTPPWKGYDNLRSVKRIVELVSETGSDIDDAIAYERQTKNRPEVIEALENLLVPEPEETVVSA